MSSSANQILSGLIETSLGVICGSIVESIFSPPNPNDPFEADVFEASAQLALNAIIIPAVGSFIVSRIDPENSTAGFLLFFGLFNAQPNLHAKMSRISADMKIGFISAVNHSKGMALKAAPPKHPDAK